MKTFHLYLLCIAFTLPGLLHAHEYEGWTVTHFSNENGLPQNSVEFVEMDSDGYLWMATQAGLVRYDGQRFNLFDKSNSALQLNRYRMLGRDSNGHIYCIDDALKVSFYNNRTGFSKPAARPGLAATKGGGLVDLNRFDMKKMMPVIKGFTNGQYPAAISFTYYPAGEGRGFMVWDYGIAAYVLDGNVRRIDTADFYPRTHRAIAVVGNKLCYIGKNKSFVLLDSNGRRSYQKIPFTVPWDKVTSDNLTVAFFKQEHRLLFNMDGNIYEVKRAGTALQFHHLIEVKDIPGIISVRHYPEKNLLVIGSTTKGLYLFRKKQLMAVGKKNSQTGNAFYALAPYGKNQVIATTGILPHSPQVPGIIESINRLSILRDRNGHYWYGNGWTLLETDDQFRVLKSVPLLRKTLVCIQEDEEGTIWLNHGHRDFGRVQGSTFQPYKLDSLDGNGIKTINHFIPAGNKTFWLVGYRLCMWLDVKHQRQRIYHEFDDVELRTAYIDKKGNLWIGSYGHGYYLLRNGRFVKMPEDKAHVLRNVHCFLEDDNGFIWMSTNSGLFQCAINDLYDYAAGKNEAVYHHYYGKESGLKTSEFNGGCTPSGLRLSNGTFALPSMDGVVMFHPDSIEPVLPESKLFIEQILLDGVRVNNSDLSKIPPSFKRLELTVSTPYFGNPRNLNIQYNIAGLDDRWYPLGENNHIVLNRLKYGKYKLRLRKEAGFGEGNYTTRELGLTVIPFFYQTWWFRVLTGIGVVLLILGFIKIRYRYLILQRNRLESEVKERTHALVYHNKLMEKLTVMIAHDLKSPLHFLSKVTGHLRKNLQQDNLQGVERTANEIKNTADQVYQFVEEFNLWASSFNNGFTISNTSFALDELLRELELFFNEMLEANNNNLVIATPVDYHICTDRALLKAILRNIIDNANKHTQGCEIRVSAHAETKQRIAITIADTGPGMNEPVLKRIQERIAQASTAASIERNSRMGYQMIIDFATRIGAKLHVQSEPKKGTCVTVYVQGEVKATDLFANSTKQVVSLG